MSIIRHVKVKGTNSLDDPELVEYWHKRETRIEKSKWSKGSKYESVAIAQDWKYLIYHDHLYNGEEIETHHIIPVKSGGADDVSNLIHLHKACHKQIHSNKSKRVGFEPTQSG